MYNGITHLLLTITCIAVVVFLTSCSNTPTPSDGYRNSTAKLSNSYDTVTKVHGPVTKHEHDNTTVSVYIKSGQR
jgi:hypothetical protein